jgi:hypothetical protein
MDENNSQLLKLGALVKVLHDRLGYAMSYQNVYRWEKEGKIVCPKLPNGKRVFTAEQIEEIVKAFGPQGSGHWSYKDALEKPSMPTPEVDTTPTEPVS